MTPRPWKDCSDTATSLCWTVRVHRSAAPGSRQGWSGSKSGRCRPSGRRRRSRVRAQWSWGARSRPEESWMTLLRTGPRPPLWSPGTSSRGCPRSVPRPERRTPWCAIGRSPPPPCSIGGWPRRGAAGAPGSSGAPPHGRWGPGRTKRRPPGGQSKYWCPPPLHRNRRTRH